MVWLRTAVLGRLGGLTPIQERVLYPAHRPPLWGGSPFPPYHLRAGVWTLPPVRFSLRFLFGDGRRVLEDIGTELRGTLP
jgi:hypothetical protein